jgi:hypothetical protein
VKRVSRSASTATRIGGLLLAALFAVSCGSAMLKPDGGNEDGGRGGRGGGTAGTGGTAGRGGTGGGTAGTGGATAGTGGGATAGTGGGATGGGTAGAGGATAGTGGGSAGRGGGGGTAGTGGSTAGTGGGAAGRGGTGGGTAGTGGATAGTGGGAAGRGGTGGGTAGTGGAPDTTRPQILDVAPFNGQTGVASNAKVVVTFSEAMNQTAVRNAYSSSALLPAQVTFSWNAAGTILTITPNNPLAYASGSSLTTPATAYAFQIGTGATDLAGNPLAAAFSSSFTTLRRITTMTVGTNVFVLLDSTPQGPSQVRPIACDQSVDQGNNVGRSVSLAFTSIRKLYVEFAIPAAPAGVTTVETATFRGTQIKNDGNPYAGGPMTADQIPFQVTPNADSNTVVPLVSFGTFSTSVSTPMPEVSATMMLQGAFTPSGSQVMVRMQIPSISSGHALTFFSCTGFSVTWTYLVP